MPTSEGPGTIASGGGPHSMARLYHPPFNPHPVRSLKRLGKRSGSSIPSGKDRLLSWKGIDHLVIVPFTEAFSQLTARTICTGIPVGEFHPHTISSL